MAFSVVAPERRVIRRYCRRSHMNLLMFVLFCATFFLLASVAFSSSVTKILVLLRDRTIFQVYCSFILISFLMSLSFAITNLTPWYRVYLVLVHVLFIPAYALVFDQGYPYKNFVKRLLLLPFLLQIFFVLANWDKEPSFFAYLWFPFCLVEYNPFPLSSIMGLLGMSFFLYFDKRWRCGTPSSTRSRGRRRNGAS